MNQNKIKEKKISIAFVLPTFFPESYGGAEQQTLKLATDLKKKNIQSLILAPKIKSNTPLMNLENNIPVYRFKLKNYPNLGGKNILSFITWSIKLIYWFLNNSKKFDIIHIIHGRLHSVPAIFAGKILKKPVIIKIGRGGEKYFDINAVKMKKIIGNFFSRYILKNTNIWIANSKIIQDNIKNKKINHDLIHKIYNGVEIDKIRINKFNKNKTFLVIGRLDEEKNCEQIIKVFSKVPEDLNAKLIFLGDGSLKNYLVKITNNLNQSHRIFFNGSVKNVSEYIINSDYYISASKSEGMSNSLLEAMSLGLPAIVSQVSGIEEIINDNKNGFVYENNNINSFYSKIINAINCKENEYLKLSQSASEHIMKNFSIDIISKKHVDLYKSLIQVG